MVAGRRFFGNIDDGNKEQALDSLKFIRDFFDLFGAFVLSDAFPSLGWLDIGGYGKAMKRTAKELNALVGGWLEEHKQKRFLGGEGNEERDFIDVMINILEDAKTCSFDADTINKATSFVSPLALQTRKAITVTEISGSSIHAHVLNIMPCICL